MIKPILNKARFVLLHVAFWTAVWFFFVYFLGYNTNDRDYVIWFSAYLMPLTMFITYFMVYYMIPKFLLTKKYGRFILYTFYMLVFSAYMIVLIIFRGYLYKLDFNISDMPLMSKNFVFVLILVYLIVGIVCFVYLLNHNFKTISRNKELHNKILETQLRLKDQELQYLKMQIHPHFLFNTLNTIYGLALKQSMHTPEVILKLSNLLDYILYQVSKPRVSLREEILHIQEYIELEKIRFQDSLDVHFISDEIDKDIQIAPMLLIPFVENAFKHGNIIDGFLRVHIKINIHARQLSLFVKNTWLKNGDKNKGGIGLENIRKRLEMHYTNNYSIHTDHENNWYSTYLSITNLNDD